MSKSLASDERWPLVPKEGSSPVADHAAGRGGRGALRSVTGFIGDGALLLLVVWLFPVAILLLGIPVALLIRLLLGGAAML